MLTVASPKEGEVALALRARDICSAIERAREASGANAGMRRVSLVILFPQSIGTDNVLRARNGLMLFLSARNLAHDIRALDGSGFAGLDAAIVPGLDLQDVTKKFITDHVGTSVFPAVHPDAWAPVLIGDPASTEAVLMASAEAKYTYRQLDRYTDLVQRTLETLPNVEKVSRSGVLPEWIQLAYSQRRLASYGVSPSRLAQIISERNTIRTGGVIDAGGTDVTVHPSGEFTDPSQIGDVIIQQTAHSGTPLYLRDLADILPGYQNPPHLLNFYTWRGADGRWNRSRAITLGDLHAPWRTD